MIIDSQIFCDARRSAIQDVVGCVRWFEGRHARWRPRAGRTG